MADEKKKSRWIETLSEAGLLDEIEDSWSLPPGPPGEERTIRVRGKGADPIPGSRGDDRERAADPGRGDDSADELPRTPVERLRSSDPAAYERSSQPQPPLVPPRGSETPRPIPLESAKRTMDGLPQTAPPADPPDAPRTPVVDDPPPTPLVEDARAAAGEPPADRGETTREVEVHGRRITVDRYQVERDTVPPDAGPIVDEPPPRDDGAAAARQTAAPGRRRGGGRRETLDLRSRSASPRSKKHESIADLMAEAAAAEPDTDEEALDPVRRMHDRYELGDFSGALDLAEEILADDPDHVEARRLRDSARDVLVKMYESRLGGLDSVPSLAVAESDLVWRKLDPSMGFVLSRVDGFSSFEDVIDVSGLPRFETCRILDQLVQEGIIKVDG